MDQKTDGKTTLIKKEELENGIVYSIKDGDKPGEIKIETSPPHIGE